MVSSGAGVRLPVADAGPMLAFDTMYGLAGLPLLGSNDRVESLPTQRAHASPIVVRSLYLRVFSDAVERSQLEPRRVLEVWMAGGESPSVGDVAVAAVFGRGDSRWRGVRWRF